MFPLLGFLLLAKMPNCFAGILILELRFSMLLLAYLSFPL